MGRVPRYSKGKMDSFWWWIGVWGILKGKVSGECSGRERVGLCLVEEMSAAELEPRSAGLRAE